MSVSASPATFESDIEITESMYLFLEELFLKGSVTICKTVRSLDVIEALFCKSIKDDGDVIRFTYKGINEFRNAYAQKLLAGTVEEDSIKYFACSYAERTSDGYDGKPIMASSDAMLNYVQLLIANGNLSISDKTCAYDYAVLDFIDEFTGESHDLFPGDTVVSVEEGYVIHKFSE